MTNKVLWTEKKTSIVTINSYLNKSLHVEYGGTLTQRFSDVCTLRQLVFKAVSSMAR